MSSYPIALLDWYSSGVLQQSSIPCQLDTVNIPLVGMGQQGSIPTDLYDLISLGWPYAKPERADYFYDPATGERYDFFGNPQLYPMSLEGRVSRIAGVQP